MSTVRFCHHRGPPIVGIMLFCTVNMVSARAESLPRFFKSAYGDARDELARKARKFDVDDPTWQPILRPAGEAAGETSVVVRFPGPARAYPVRFGIPLGQVVSCANVAVYDEQGRPLAVDVFPLVNFKTCPRHWVLVCLVLDSPDAGDRKLSLRWGPQIRRPPPATELKVEKSGDSLTVRGGRLTFSLSPDKLLSDIRLTDGEEEYAPNGCSIGFTPEAGSHLKRRPDRMTTLFDGPLHKHFRIESTVLEDRFKTHFEVQTFSDSPYLLIASRFINESGQSYRLSDLRPLALEPGQTGRFAASVGGRDAVPVKCDRQVAIRQRVDDWSIVADDQVRANGRGDAPGDWAQLSTGPSALTLIVPDFQGFGPGDPDLESSLSAATDGEMFLNHYGSFPADAGGTITFWGTAARTFRLVLHLGPNKLTPASVVDVARERPHVIYDPEFLAAQGVFNEQRITDLYAEPSLEAARYFDRTRAGRHDYPRTGRGMPPHKSEGEFHPYTDTGGLLFGEVWQYASKNPASVAATLVKAREPEGNLPAWYEPEKREGTSTYRCGDHALALALSYLRTGDRDVFEVFQDHGLLYADWAIAHPEGYCHYYCDWHAGVHAYSRLAGPLMSYLIEGDPWFYEVAEQMGGYLVRSWNGKEHPLDRQTRSAYPVRGLTWLYEVNGHRSYWNNAVDLAVWFMQTGLESDGSVRGFANHSGYRRISPLYAGYTLCGLIPLYERCPNPELLQVLRRCGEWLLTCQGTMQDRQGAGT